MKKVRLGDITIQMYDGKHGDCKDEENSGYYFISVKDLNDFEINYKNARQITKSDFEANYQRTLLENGDTIYANTGDTIGKSLFVIDNTLAKYTSFQKSIAVIKPDKKQVNPRYLFYLLKYLTPQLRNAATGSSQKNLLLSTMRNFELSIHERKLQNKIASVLGNIDDKILNNYHINNNLEELMQTLYQRWFIEFNFPNEEGKPYKSSGGKMVWNEELKQKIPEDWKVLSIKDVLNVITGKEDANFSTKDGKYKFFTCSNDILKCDVPAFNGKAVLIAGNGDFNVKYYDGEFNAYQRTYVLMPEDEKYIGEIYLNAINTINKFKKGSNGSIVKFITKGDVENIKILIPKDNRLLFELNKKLDQIQHFKKENEDLAELRDFLLPMLMNGQINVDDVEI